MVKEKVLVIGLGEVGRALFELLKEKFSVYGIDADKTKMREISQSLDELPTRVDVMHVCIPYSERDRFVKTTVDYTERFNPKLVIIESTVAPGTTMQVFDRCNRYLIAHSPVRGVHKNLEHMKYELKRWTKYIGGVNAQSSEAAEHHFEKLGLKTKVLRSCKETELAKLFETTYRAWMIACFQEMHRISMYFGSEFDDVVDFLEDTHRLRLDRPVMFPGVIGGHCLIPNIELLLNSYNSEFLRLILKSNKKRKEELENEKVQREIGKIEKRVKALDTFIHRLLKMEKSQAKGRVEDGNPTQGL